MSALRRWLPTAELLGAAAVIAALFVATRILLGPIVGQEAGPLSPPEESSPVVQPAAAVPPFGDSRQGSQAEGPLGRGVRFVAVPVEPSYTVVAGDTLWTIAQRHNTTADAIQSINNLPDRATLRVGQRLIMP